MHQREATCSLVAYYNNISSTVPVKPSNNILYAENAYNKMRQYIIIITSAIILFSSVGRSEILLCVTFCTMNYH